MIKNKKDYFSYLECDCIALNRDKNIKDLLFDDIWRFQRWLRKLEYLRNCKKSLFSKICAKILAYRFMRLSVRLGFSIPVNVFGPGLSIAHYGSIVVNHNAKIGKNCRIHTCVNIGTKAGTSDQAPIIGDNVYIAPGAKIFGPIIIGNGIAIGANSVVNKSFEEDNITIAGAPARKISDKGSYGFLFYTQ